MPLRLLPLRERPLDVVPLAERVLARLAGGGGPRVMLSPAAADRLRAHAWPGNVRELDNALQRATVLATGPVLAATDLVFEAGDADPHADAAGAAAPGAPPQGAAPAPDAPAAGGALEDGVRDRERVLILAALEAERGSRNAAASRLGISPRTLRHKLAQFRAAGLETTWDRRTP
jgi:two-component system response regulator FlrC